MDSTGSGGWCPTVDGVCGDARPGACRCGSGRWWEVTMRSEIEKFNAWEGEQVGAQAAMSEELEGGGGTTKRVVEEDGSRGASGGCPRA